VPCTRPSPDFYTNILYGETYRERGRRSSGGRGEKEEEEEEEEM
jgi:hypothetical protein